MTILFIFQKSWKYQRLPWKPLNKYVFSKLDLITYHITKPRPSGNRKISSSMLYHGIRYNHFKPWQYVSHQVESYESGLTTARKHKNFSLPVPGLSNTFMMLSHVTWLKYAYWWHHSRRHLRHWHYYHKHVFEHPRQMRFSFWSSYFTLRSCVSNTKLTTKNAVTDFLTWPPTEA